MSSSIIRFLLDPFHILLILLIISFITSRFFQKRFFMAAAVAAGAWFLLITTPFLPYAVLNSLEKKYLPVTAEEHTQVEDLHIIVLGAGYVYNKSLPANSQLDKQMLARLAEGVRIYNHYPNSRLITSGPYNIAHISQAEVAKQAAILFGVPDSAVLTQSEGYTTHGEANVYHRKFHTGQKVVVVTSASHMHRALGEFRRLGVDAVPSPAYYRYRDEDGLRVSFIPSISNIDAMRSGMFEYAALFRNYLRDL